MAGMLILSIGYIRIGISSRMTANHFVVGSWLGTRKSGQRQRELPSSPDGKWAGKKIKPFLASFSPRL